jgi:type IV pilus assembly protein PilM
MPSGSKPKLACEVAADRVLAGRVAEHGGAIEMCAAGELSPGSLVPDLTETNLRDRAGVSKAIRETLGAVSGRARDVIAVLPDTAVRVALLDFETLPTKRQEAESVVRFRLKKSLPFDIEKAKVSYHTQTAAGGLRVIAAVALTSVIEDYESVFREAGYTPGVVLPSMLAALGATRAEKPSMVVKVDARTASIAILQGQQLLLFRTLENAWGAKITGEQLGEEVYPSIVFFQDTYHLNLEQIFVAGLADSAALPALNIHTGVAVEELVSSSQLGSSFGAVPKWRMAGVVGALLS